MTDIIIYTAPEKLLHKQDKLENDKDKSDIGEYYWAFYNFPKKIEEEDKVYFATKGFIRGYFIIDKIDYTDNTITFDSKSWKDIKPIPITHFQGFKYVDDKLKQEIEVINDGR